MFFRKRNRCRVQMVVFFQLHFSLWLACITLLKLAEKTFTFALCNETKSGDRRLINEVLLAEPFIFALRATRFQFRFTRFTFRPLRLFQVLSLSAESEGCLQVNQIHTSISSNNRWLRDQVLMMHRLGGLVLFVQLVLLAKDPINSFKDANFRVLWTSLLSLLQCWSL